GRAELRCARASADVGVLVTGAHRPFRATLPTFGEEPFRAVVAPGAALRGRLVPHDFVARCSRYPDAPDARCLALVIRRAGSDDIVQPPGGRERGHPIAADGTFAVT